MYTGTEEEVEEGLTLWTNLVNNNPTKYYMEWTAFEPRRSFWEWLKETIELTGYSYASASRLLTKDSFSSEEKIN